MKGILIYFVTVISIFSCKSGANYQNVQVNGVIVPLPDMKYLIKSEEHFSADAREDIEYIHKYINSTDSNNFIQFSYLKSPRALLYHRDKMKAFYNAKFPFTHAYSCKISDTLFLQRKDSMTGVGFILIDDVRPRKGFIIQLYQNDFIYNLHYFGKEVDEKMLNYYNHVTTSWFESTKLDSIKYESIYDKYGK